MISKDLAAHIVRLGKQEKWKVHTISKQLGVHHSTVERALADSGQTCPVAPPDRIATYHDNALSFAP